MSKPHGIAVLLGLALFVAGGCSSSSPTEPLPEGAVEFQPPAIFELWWTELQDCSGKTGDFTRIKWYTVPGPGTFQVGSDPDVVGLWQPQHSSISLAQYAWQIPNVVRHEELHAILNRTDHPAEFFVDKCGSLVTH